VYGWSSNQVEGIRVEIEEDDVPNNVAVIVADNVLLGLADFKTLEAVDTKRREQLESIRPLNVHVCHVIRLVEQHAAVLPGALLVSPVRKLGWHNRINIRADLGVPQEIYRIPGRLQHVLQTSLTHITLTDLQCKR
jgi:hypothetical protein